MLQILEYLTSAGVSPFGQWFGKLDAQVAEFWRDYKARSKAAKDK